MMELLETSRADLKEDLALGVRALLEKAFPESASSQRDYYSTCGTPTVILVLRQDRQVLGHLAVYERHVKIGAEALNIGMIGGIAIASEHRRMGHSRILVRRAHEYLRGRSIPFSILFAYEPRVYESSGYKLMENETRFLDIDGAWKTFVYRGGMHAELQERPWPSQTLDLCGGVV